MHALCRFAYVVNSKQLFGSWYCGTSGLGARRDLRWSCIFVTAFVSRNIVVSTAIFPSKMNAPPFSPTIVYALFRQNTQKHQTLPHRWRYMHCRFCCSPDEDRGEHMDGLIASNHEPPCLYGWMALRRPGWNFMISICKRK